MFELHNFEYIQIGIASPEKIRSWAMRTLPDGTRVGEVTKSETINYKSQKPEPDGLFCEKIFGPTKDWECHCGRYKKVRYKGMTCEKCKVDIVQKDVRRERMGVIELAAPVAHLWYSKGNPSKIGLLLDLNNKELEQIIYLKNYVVLDPGNTELEYKSIVSLTKIQNVTEEIESRLDADGNPIKCTLRVGMGAEAIKELLMAVDIEKECEKIRDDIQNTPTNNSKRERLVKRLEIVESFKKSGNKPEWMILDVVPVIPPELRPMVPLEGGRYATSDLNELYRRVIGRNNRLKKFIAINSPPAVLNNEKRMLQEAVDALIDNGKKGGGKSKNVVTGPGNRELKSLSALLRGKQGRFRQNLLGKRVDYSGRSVIVVGPELKLYQCGLPKEMAIELFKPFVMKRLVDMKECNTVKAARHTVERLKPIVWDILEEVIKDHPVLLNRAPTLHRLSIQAFEPVLIEGRAIKLHPLVCTAFNADFDGDQMAVHVPLSIEAQAEARFLMLASNNILKLSDGQPVMSPSQDMVLGCYYLTIKRREIGKEYIVNGVKEVYNGVMCASEEEALLAYQTKNIALQDEIYIRRTIEIDGVKQTGRIRTTVGRMIFNHAIPQDIDYVFKSDSQLNPTEQEKEKPYLNDKRFQFKVDALIKKKELKQIVDACFKQGGSICAANTLDSIKSLGYKYSTIGALTTSVFDMLVPETKYAVIEQATKDAHKITKQFGRGLLTEDERYRAVVDIWNETTNKVTDILKKSQEKFNPIWMMADSGARGSIDQLKQLAGMRGLMSNPQGKIIEIPVKSCYREGLSVLEYFISSHGGRKGLADTALKTSDSGYLTRRLVDVSQVVIVREDDCGDKKGMEVSAIMSNDGDKPVENLADRISGRFTIDAVMDGDKMLAPADSMITEEQAKAIEAAGIKSVRIRSVFSCKTYNGVCTKCYGKNMSSMSPVPKGEAVGIIAAQSIGEPGTQLTMRTFHTGGIASAGDITQGLPRIEELFEVRNPKGKAVICEVSGVVSLHENEKNGARIVKVTDSNGTAKDYAIPFSAQLLVKEGDVVEPGTLLTVGSAYPKDILKTRGVKGVQDYILKEVQSAYRSKGVEINDKHVEVIVRQMLRKVRIENCGDTSLLPGELVDITKYEEENFKTLENGGRPATASRILQGITKASLSSESFLSAASFQETEKVLTEAAIKSKIDPLVGLKENIILGKLIPAGTGSKEYKNLNTRVVGLTSAERYASSMNPTENQEEQDLPEEE